MFAKDLFLRSKNLTARGCAHLLHDLAGVRPPAASPRPPAAPTVPPAATTQRPPAATTREHVDSAEQRDNTDKNKDNPNTNANAQNSNIDRRRPLPGQAYAGSHGLGQPRIEGTEQFGSQPAASSDEEAIELKQPPVDVTAPGGLAAPDVPDLPTGERLATEAERRVYSQANALDGQDVSTKFRTEGERFAEKKRDDAREVHEQIQPTRERDLEKMRKTGFMEENQPEKEIENHKRQT